MKTVLVTAIGSAAAEITIKRLKELSYRVIGCDIYPENWHAECAMVDMFFKALPVGNEESYIEQIKQWTIQEKIDYILPLTDVEVDVLCKLHNEFAQLGCKVLTPDRKCAELCRNKPLMTDYVNSLALCQTIPTYTPESTPPKDVAFPLVFKPKNGRSSQGHYTVNTLSEYEHVLTQIDKSYIVQPFIKGNIYTVDVARDSSGNVRTLVRQEWLRTGNGLGTTVETYQSHQLMKVAETMANAIDLVGVVNIEFIANGDEYYFLEINPRFSGGVGFSVLAGMDMIEMQMLCHEKQSIEKVGKPQSLLMASYYQRVITRV